MQVIKFARNWFLEEDFSVSDNFPSTCLRVFQIGQIFKAAMDGQASDKIRQELVSEEDFSVSENFPGTGLRVFQIGGIFQAAMWEKYHLPQQSRPWLLKHVGLSFMCLAFRLFCTVYCMFPSTCLLPDHLCCLVCFFSYVFLFISKAVLGPCFQGVSFSLCSKPLIVPFCTGSLYSGCLECCSNFCLFHNCSVVLFIECSKLHDFLFCFDIVPNFSYTCSIPALGSLLYFRLFIQESLWKIAFL